MGGGGEGFEKFERFERFEKFEKSEAKLRRASPAEAERGFKWDSVGGQAFHQILLSFKMEHFFENPLILRVCGESVVYQKKFWLNVKGLGLDCRGAGPTALMPSIEK